MVIAALRVFEKLPSVFLHKHDGTGQFSTRLMIYPGEMVRQFSAPTRFKLVPLASSGVILELQEGFEARGSFWSELKRWKHVAIFCEKKGTFLSCRRKTHIPGLGDSSLVEYRTTPKISDLRILFVSIPQRVVSEQQQGPRRPRVSVGIETRRSDHRIPPDVGNHSDSGIFIHRPTNQVRWRDRQLETIGHEAATDGRGGLGMR